MSASTNSSEFPASSTHAAPAPVGVSGLALYVPRPRVALESWCAWTGATWNKVKAVVGESFRIPAPHESLYTMAANAALRLIETYDIDPSSIGYLALGTESSTDNSTGAAIVKGMLDQRLMARGLPPISRACEIPEFKQACLGGIYALKGALRYVATDGRERRAIVISADIAEYQRGSSGEQTQGAGAVAMLVERHPAMFAVDLERSGNAADYRGLDFRKPTARHAVDGYAHTTQRPHDFPVFNGRYSTHCFVDATARAFQQVAERSQSSQLSTLNDAYAVFMHRPYHRMPLQAFSMIYLWALASDPERSGEVAELCRTAEVDEAALRDELSRAPHLLGLVTTHGEEADPYPLAGKVAGVVRKSPEFRSLSASKLGLGSQGCRDLGNLYTASLPAWLCSGFDAAAAQGLELAGETLLAIGYGSGDASEALVLRPVNGWQVSAGKIEFARALQGAVDIEREVYEQLHDTRRARGFELEPKAEFIVRSTGNNHGDGLQDIGIEYYEYAD